MATNPIVHVKRLRVFIVEDSQLGKGGGELSRLTTPEGNYRIGAEFQGFVGVWWSRI